MLSVKHFVLLFTFTFGVIESKQFRPDYTYHQAIDGWLKLHVPGTWREARQRCYLEGAVLASPVTEAMQAALRAEMNESSVECAGIYTGVHSIFSKGYFYSLEGEPLSKMSVPWYPGQPDNVDNNEDCIAYGNDGVADVNCSEVLPFVCYKKSTEDMTIMPCGTTDKEYEFSRETGSCYKLHKIKRTWAEAFKVCSAERGYLAIINSREEASVLKGINFSHRNISDDTRFGNIYSQFFPNPGHNFQGPPPPVRAVPHRSLIVTHIGNRHSPPCGPPNPGHNIGPPGSVSVGPDHSLIVTHIGIYDWDRDGTWRTVHGQTLEEAGYVVWHTGQPDNKSPGEFCGAMFLDATLNDYSCDSVENFLCEKDPNIF